MTKILVNLIEPEVFEYAKSKGKKNILIYRDIPFGSCSRCSGKNSYFTPSVKLSGKDPDKYFTLLERTDGISLWVEKALLPKIQGSGYVKISLKKGFFKGLAVEFSSELTEAWA